MHEEQQGTPEEGRVTQGQTRCDSEKVAKDLELSIKEPLPKWITAHFKSILVDYSPLIAATPGSTLPSIASSSAPPPVEM